MFLYKLLSLMRLLLSAEHGEYRPLLLVIVLYFFPFHTKSSCKTAFLKPVKSKLSPHFSSRHEDRLRSY